MKKLSLILIVLLLGGCTTDFSEVKLAEEKPVYIHFASDANINASVSESTRGGANAYDTLSIGILGLGVQETELSAFTRSDSLIPARREQCRSCLCLSAPH